MLSTAMYRRILVGVTRADGKDKVIKVDGLTDSGRSCQIWTVAVSTWRTGGKRGGVPDHTRRWRGAKLSSQLCTSDKAQSAPSGQNAIHVTSDRELWGEVVAWAHSEGIEEAFRAHSSAHSSGPLS